MIQPPARTTLRQLLERSAEEMVEKGIYWKEARSQFEKLFILRALAKNRGNLLKTAETMGIHRNTLTHKLREHGIDKNRWKG